MLSPNDFWTAGSLTQFISIDLIVKHNDRYLLGMRNNQPAKGTLFVPGSKTFKGNTLSSELSRISKFELNLDLSADRFELIAISDHIYDRNFQDEKYGTHYVCLANLVEISDAEVDQLTPDDQHSSLIWMNADEICQCEQVHKFTKYYFANAAPNTFYRTRVCR